MTDPTRSPGDVARSAIPGLNEAERALETVRDRLAANRRAQMEPPVDLAALVVDAAMAGEPLPADLGERRLAAGQRGQVLAAEAAVLAAAESVATSRRGEALRVGGDAGIRALRPMLDQVLAAARRAADALGDIGTADEAIRAGRAAAWQQLDAAARQYRAIRQAASWLYQTGGGHTDVGAASVDYRSIVSVVGDFSNVDEVWEGWHSWHADDEGSPPWPQNDDRAFVAWLAANELAEPWVGTLAELGEAFHRQQQAAQRRARAAEEESTHGRPLTAEERRQSAERAANKNAKTVKRAARIAAASTY